MAGTILASVLIGGLFLILGYLYFDKCLFTIAAFGFEKSMLPAYLGTVVLLSGFVSDSVEIRKTVCVIAGAALLLTAVICNVYKGNRSFGCADSF